MNAGFVTPTCPLPSTTQGHALKDGDIPADVVVSLMEMSDALHKGSYSLQAWLGSPICSIFLLRSVPRLSWCFVCRSCPTLVLACR